MHGPGFHSVLSAIGKIGIVRTMIVTYLIPLFGVFWGFLFLDELITLNITIGAMLILAGVAMTTGVLSYFLQKKRDHAET